MLYFFLRLLAVLLFKTLFRIRVTGREKIPKGGVLLVSNHTSHIDPVALGVAFPRPLYFFARWDLFSNPFFGTLIQHLHAFPVHIGGRDKDAIQGTIQKLREGKTVVLFPEGSRSRDGSFHRGQAGAGLIASKTGVPVLPAYIRGSHKVLPRGARMIRLGEVSVHFGKPLFFSPARDVPGDIMKSHHAYYQKISNQLMEAIREIKDLTE